ncbi:hypothetical protein [Enterobacter mori]|uniref:hypothetical protein n=1 Tax=Enterobacter mori TaxID=539813 RepID=UPI001B8C4E76|nr:hypothetical protein [Enterobacter mori]MBS3049636.1 hypothetical protein [Enterobacter mori]
MYQQKRRLLGKLLHEAEMFGVTLQIHLFPGRVPQLVVMHNENGKIWQPAGQCPGDKQLTGALAGLARRCQEIGFELDWQSPVLPDIRTLTLEAGNEQDWYAEVEAALQQIQIQAMHSGLDLILSQRPRARAGHPWQVVKPEALPIGSLDKQAAMATVRALNEQLCDLTLRFPLHMVLTLQPNQCPEAYLEVTAPLSGVSWRFEEANARQPISSLLAEMKDKSVTKGWDAITMYHQGEANRLLHQQHIKRIVDKLAMPPINANFTFASTGKLYMRKLTLSTPVLSFESANLSNSLARLSMNFIKGILYYKVKRLGEPLLITKIERVSPLNFPKLFMDIDLTKAPGSVTDKGEVQINLVNGGNVSTNFMENEADQNLINGYFQSYFKELPEDRRKYLLGGYSSYSNAQLTPKSFTIRTMASPNGKTPGTEDHGNGAIVLFTTLDGGSDGAIPSSLPWLLPDGRSASLVLSNRVVFERLFKSRIESDVGNGLRFRPFSETGSPDRAWKLEANAGALSHYVKKHYKRRSDDFSAFFETTYQLPMAGTGKSGSVRFTVSATDNTRILVRWQETAAQTSYYNYTDYDWPCSDEHLRGNVNYSYHYQLNFRLSLDSQGIVTFSRESSPSVQFEQAQLDNIWDLPRAEISADARSAILSKMQNALQNLSLPAINTFTLRNLLFPQENQFQANEVYLPGDLLISGKLGPGQSSFAINPLELSIVAGSAFTFTTSPAVSGVTWSLLGTEGETTNLGTINASSGHYTAPAANTIPNGVRYVVICAEQAGKKTYAQVAVVAVGVAVSPSYILTEPETTLDLQGAGINGAALSWKLLPSAQNSTLSNMTNSGCRYTAGAKNNSLDHYLERVEVTASGGAKNHILIVVANRKLDGEIGFVLGSNPESGRVALQFNFTVEGDDGDQEFSLSGEDVEWKVLEPGGVQFDEKQGILTMPSGPTADFALVSAKYKLEGILTFSTVTAIPLPFQRLD